MANVFSGVTDWLSGGTIGTGQDQLAQAAQNILNTPVPDLTKLIPVLQQQVASGQITPAEASAAVQKASEAQGIKTNPALVDQQFASLQGLNKIATQGGMTAIDKAQLADIQNQLSNKNAAEQSAIQTNLQQRGMGGQGAEIAGRLNASQGNANAGYLAGTGVAANAQSRALEALQGAGKMAGSINEQQFQQNLQKAQAQDAINKFNAQNAQTTSEANAQRNQLAQQQNVANTNTINATNTGIRNTQAAMPYNAAQTTYENLLKRSTGAAQPLATAGAANIKQGNQQADTSSGWLGDLAGAALTYFSDEKMKEDVKPADDDVYVMMEHLTGKKWKYKPDTVADDGGQQHIGPMAQDVEQAGLPVQDTADGKKIVFGPETSSAMLAALGNLHSRIKKIEGEQ